MAGLITALTWVTFDGLRDPPFLLHFPLFRRAAFDREGVDLNLPGNRHTCSPRRTSAHSGAAAVLRGSNRWIFVFPMEP